MRVTLPPIRKPLTKNEGSDIDTENATSKDRFYLPSLFTEKTRILPTTHLDRLLEEFYGKYVYVDQSFLQRRLDLAKTVLGKLVRVMRLAKYSHTVVPSNRPPILVGDFQNNPVSSGIDVEYLLPLTFSASFRKREIAEGYVSLALPGKLPGAKDVFEPIRSNNKVHLSPTKVYSIVYEMLRHGIRFVQHIETLNVLFRETGTGCRDLVLEIGSGLRVHVIPTIAISSKRLYFVAKPFDSDCGEQCDIKWRYDFSKEESDILDRVSVADRGNRLKALRITKCFLNVDKSFEALSSYHLDSCLFNLVEKEIDFHPGWQRKNVRTCVLELMEFLLDAVYRQSLLHSHLSGINLFHNFSVTGTKLMVRKLQSLTTEHGLLRELSRTLSKLDVLEQNIN